MKKKNIILIAAAVLVAVLALLIALRGSKKATFKQDYHIADTQTITRLFLADKQERQALLTKVNDSLWLVDGEYEASLPTVNLLLETLGTMRIRQQVNRNAVPNVIKDLAARAIKCEVYQRVPRINWFGGRLQLFPHEKLTTTYYIGSETQDQMATFAFREGDKVPVIVHIPGFRGFLTPRFLTDPLKWRSHRIVDLDVISSRAVRRKCPISTPLAWRRCFLASPISTSMNLRP